MKGLFSTYHLERFREEAVQETINALREEYSRELETGNSENGLTFQRPVYRVREVETCQ